jgi:indolepyruvate ferredoxin oxidoreductase beta subunit
MYVNSNSQEIPRKEVENFVHQNGIIYHSVPASEIAVMLEAPLSTNLALLGFFAASGDGPFSAEEITGTVERISPDRFKETNIQVFNAGFKHKR